MNEANRKPAWGGKLEQRKFGRKAGVLLTAGISAALLFLSLPFFDWIHLRNISALFGKLGISRETASTLYQSYRYFMNHNLFDHVNIDKENTNVPNGLARDPEAECARYDGLIRELGGIDLQLLGIGGNGHIGFNEPGEVFEKGTHVVTLTEETRRSNARFFSSIDEVPTHALTMGIGGIMSAKKVLLLASGEAKAQALYDSCLGPVTPAVQASVLQLHGDAVIIADEAALGMIREKTGWTGEVYDC